MKLQASILLASLLLLAGCTSQNDAYKALTGAGFTDIEYTGYSFFECADSDTFHTGFRAKNPQGQVVEGTVCSGWFKGATIRY